MMKEYYMPSNALFSVCKIMTIFFAMGKLPRHNWKQLKMASIKIVTPDSKELDEKGYHIMEFPDVMIEEEIGNINNALKQKYNINNDELHSILASIKHILNTGENLTTREMKNFNNMYKKVQKRKYWYRQYIGECPVCGKDYSFRERVYGKKPKDTTEIYIMLSYTETYDHCMGL